MKNYNIKKHDFHIVLSNELKIRIKDLSIKLKKSLSCTAIYIIDRSLNFFRKIHFTVEESSAISNYQCINWNEDMHIYFDKNLYRKIKHLGDTHFAFSVAIIIRWLFNYYFDNLYDIENNKENKEKIKRINREITEYEKTIIVWNKNIENKQLSGFPYYQITFNDKFSIIGFNFLSPE